MKSLNLFFGALLTLALTAPAYAQSETPAETPHITQGHVTVGGSLGMIYSSYTGAVYSMTPQAEYFLADRFSLGGTVEFSASRDYRVFGIGPSLTYHFWQSQSNRWTSSIAAAALIKTYKSEYFGTTTSYLSAQSTLGLNYFFNPAVSFGPNLTYVRSFENNGRSNVFEVGYMTLLFKLSIFL